MIKRISVLKIDAVYQFEYVVHMGILSYAIFLNWLLKTSTSITF